MPHLVGPIGPISPTGLVAGALVLACAVALLRRWGVWRWLALLAAVPALLVTAQAAPGAATALLLFSLAITVACWRAWATYRQELLAVVLLLSGVLVWHLTDAGAPPPPGPVRAGLALALLLTLAAGAGIGRSRLLPLRMVVLATAGVPVLVFVGTGTTAMITSWAPVSGALAVTALLRGSRGRRSAVPQVDDVDRAALADFDAQRGQRSPDTRLGPVVVVIAAYNEASGLPAVVASIPTVVAGLDVDLVVVDDASTDGTADAAEQAGAAYVVRCPTNRGQGAALRLGYRIAREHGASYVVTTDADGQYDVGDFPAVLAPILADRADFVTGSRRLGHQPVQDPLRRLGVHVFAWLVSALCGRRLTDTSFGLRAMRVEVTAAVTLNQPQYQSSELLIGALSHGFRVAEVPGTMHSRTVGASKKGRNLVYGRRYAGVVLGTWWREGCPAPVTGCPAVSGSRDHERAESRSRSGASPAA